MKYKLAKELIENVKIYDEMDDLIIFKKPFTKRIHFKFKDRTEKTFNLKEYSYISLSNHGFLFIRNDDGYKTFTVHLNNVEDLRLI